MVAIHPDPSPRASPTMSLTQYSLRPIRLLATGLLLQGCAVLHSVQLGDIDSKTVLSGQAFEIKVSELGINTEDLIAIGEAIGKASGYGKEADTIGDIIELFQTGPRTGNPTFTEKYSDNLRELLLQECPSGNITGLMAIRETAQYPVVSGEIVRLVGYCAKD